MLTQVRPLPSAVVDHHIEGRNLGRHTTIGSLLDATTEPTLLVFLRHHG